jgi:lipopolysaccharide cholinephosphotransferase
MALKMKNRMKELSLKDQQSMGLAILKDVHSFCVQQGIRYSVAYGTLIGAIRHHGFIPWDDDIDIIMPRPDYERFCEEYVSSRFRLICHQNDANCLIAYARVIDENETLCISKVPWCSQQVGIWIDVFPVDSVSDTMSSFVSTFRLLRKQWKQTVIERQARQPISTFDYHLFPTMKLLAKKVLSLNGKHLEMHIEQLILDGKEFEWGSTSHWAQLTCLDGNAFAEYMPIEALSSFHEVYFDGISVMIMVGYETVLTNLYGNYMCMPPVEDQIPHNNLLNKWYWK